MTEEDEYDAGWLFRRAGGNMAPHRDAERQKAYERLEEALKGLPVKAPPGGWKREILATIADVVHVALENERERAEEGR